MKRSHIPLILSAAALALAACATATPAPVPVAPTATLLTFPPTFTPAPVTPTAEPVAQPGLTFFEMAGEADGWGADQTHVLRTRDGGAAWADVSPENLPDLGFAPRLDVLDADHVWFVVGKEGSYDAGTLYQTANGGENWIASQVPFAAGDIHFLDPKNGWILADRGVGAGSNAISVFQTTDGGQTWTQTYTDDPTLPGSSNTLPLGGLKYGLVPVDMQRAWVGGIVYASGVIYLYRTGDGGKTWTLQNVPVPDIAREAQLETNGPLFVGAKDAYLPVHYTADAVQTLIYVSHDGGSTWSLLPGRIPGGGQVEFVSPTEAFAWDGGQLNATHDGAKSWRPIFSSTTFGADFWKMDFISPSVGWALTMDSTTHVSLFKTADGGLSWNVLIP